VLTTLVQIAQILGPTAVAIGVIFGVIQIRIIERQRREQAAVVIVHSFQSGEFNRAVRLVWAIPPGTTAAQLRGGAREIEEAAVFISTTLETIGVLVHRHVVPLNLVDDLMGDAIVNFWPRLQDWVETMRKEQSRESVYEWFQWLVDRLAERERRRTIGAHVRYAAWKS